MEAVAEISTAVKNVPALRFPEFEGEWKKKSIGSIATKVGSGSTPSGGERVYQESGIPFIRSQNVNDNQLILDNISFISEEINNRMKGSVVKAKDVLLNITGASIGRSCVVPNDFVIGNVNQHVCIIRLNDENTPSFLQAYLSSYDGQKSLERSQVGSGREGLNFQSIRSIKLYLPFVQEQQKIASFLNAADNKIQQLSKKKELLEKYKKGVMQQIFSQQIRFKDDNGNDFPEWKRKKLKEILIEGRLGGNYNNSETNEGIPLIKMGNLGRGNINLDKVQCLPSEEIYSDEDVLNKGDLLFNTRNTLELVGKVAIWRNEIPFALYNSNLMRLKFDSQIESSNRFMNYYFNVNSSIKQLRAYATGTTSVAAIYGRDLQNFKVTFPCLEEQIKIADFLTSIDNKLSYTSKQLEQAQQFKKGLLQQLFV